jgi:hypothetical protein
MPRVGFEPTIPVFERAKTVHALYHATSVIGVANNNKLEIKMYQYNCKQPPKEGTDTITETSCIQNLKYRPTRGNGKCLPLYRYSSIEFLNL